MPISHIHTYLVHPAKGEEKPLEIGGALVNLSGKMFDLLNGIYEKAEQECDVAISFNKSSSGTQQNPCRDLIIAYSQGPTLVRGRKIAERLASVTTNRSRLGLLFLIYGTEGPQHKLIISRFPADSGIMAEQKSEGLNVEFLEKIFMKSAKSYKSVMYKHQSLTSGFWQGQAVDKQMNSSEVDISGYWISEFLDSDFRTTSAAGTRRLAVACRDASRKTSDVAIKSEIAAAVTLSSGFDGKKMSSKEFITGLGLSKAAQDAVFAGIKQSVLNEKFQVSSEEFSSVISYRSIELDTGGLLTAEIGSFNDVFHVEPIKGEDQKFRFTTEGKIVSEKIGKAR